MADRTLGLLHPGEMGQVVGLRLREAGHRVLVALDGRGAETRARASEAGLEDVGDIPALVGQAQAVLSILVPSAAADTAQAVAGAMREAGTAPLYADCNAIAAATSREIGAVIEAAGGHYVDASIVGPPPRKPGVTRFYASGPHEQAFADLLGEVLDVRPLGPESGRASALKTCYASLTKGLSALVAIQLIAARRQGLDAALRAELETSQAALYQWAQGFVSRMPPKAHRWIAEMEEHARAFTDLGLPGDMMHGAAELYRFVADTPAARMAPSGQAVSLEEAVAAMAEALGEGPPA